MQVQFTLAALLVLLPISVWSLPTPIPQDHVVDVVSNSVSPVSDNNAGNGNSNTGILNGNSFKLTRTIRRNSDNPTDVVSNSLSPGSDNVAGNDNKNTGTGDGNTVDIDPKVDVSPTVNAK